MQFQRETLFDVIEEVQPLLEDHYRELAKRQDRVKLNPDWARYSALEQAGALLIFTARDGGTLKGYSAFFAHSHPHYMDLMLVSNDVLFIDPSHRVGRTGVRLIRYCEEQIAQQFGKDYCIAWHAKENTALATMLGRMDYGVQDIIYSRLF